MAEPAANETAEEAAEEATEEVTEEAAKETENQTEPDSQAAQAVEVGEAELPEATDSGAKTAGGQIDILLDAIIPISVTLGRTELKVREVLELGANSVVKLDKQVGEPVDLYLRGTKFAEGNLVVVEDNLGVRISEILSPADEEKAEG